MAFGKKKTTKKPLPPPPPPPGKVEKTETITASNEPEEMFQLSEETQNAVNLYNEEYAMTFPPGDMAQLSNLLFAIFTETNQLKEVIKELKDIVEKQAE